MIGLRRLPTIPTLVAATIYWFVAVTPVMASFQSETSGTTNQMCPVMTDQEAVDDYTIEYRGQEVRFCCQECQGEFLREPTKYEAHLGLTAESWSQQAKAFYDEHTEFSMMVALAGLLVLLRLYRVIRKPSEADLNTFAGRLLGKSCSPVVPLLLMLCVIGYHFRVLAMDRHDRFVEGDIHYATFYDFGYPPLPKHPPIEARVKGTFYRGNDERNTRLFNNGNYRTATFHVAIVDEDGHQIEVGDEVQGRQLSVRLTIERPPFTPDFLYEARFMKSIFLTQECDRFLGRSGPVTDRVNLTTIEPMQRWEANYPIASCCSKSDGVVYVCEEYHYQPWYKGGQIQRGGSRFHYAIQYALAFENGRLAEGSDLWMGALYRTRKFRQATVPLDQWFSHKPIPELPSANVDDPELLGITDYQ